jgi:hypothetical protein
VQPKRRPVGPTYPIQAPPVARDERGEAASSTGVERGIVPARSPCSGLPGMARQMCYAAEYGISM